MNIRRLLTVCLLTALPLAAGSAAAFTWPQNGVNLGWPASSPHDACLVPDGEGGAIVAWYDYTGGSYNIVAQRVSGHGQVLWGDTGVIVAPYASSKYRPRSVSDSAGGAIIVWIDYRNGDIDLYAQRLDAGGNRLWTTTGVPVVVQTGDQDYPVVVADGYGGVIVAWQDARGGLLDVYAQRITAAGSAAWTANGVAVCTATGDGMSPAIATDGMGGAVIAWEDYRAGPTSGNIYAQRVYYDGTPMWTADGVAVCTANNIQRYVGAVEDGAGGSILIWSDTRSGAAFYGQRVDPYGTAAWAANGALVQASVSLNAVPRLAGDAAGGAYVIWDQEMTGHVDVRAQRVSGAGTAYWAAAGVPICTLPSTSQTSRVAPDGIGGAIIAWSDYRASYSDIYAQRIDASGTVSWAADGVQLCGANYHQYSPALTTDGAGGAIVAWQDLRDQLPRMAAQRIDRNGFWGYPSPDIRAVRDVPGDEGGAATVSWYASRLDPWPTMAIDNYTVWRAVPPELAKANLAAGKSRVVDLGAAGLPAVSLSAARAKGTGAGGQPGVYRLEALAGRTFFWELVDIRDAYHLSSYAATVPTLYDSTDASPATQYFQVIAHTTDPAKFWISAPDSGVSVDNLAPAEPLDLAGKCQYAPAGLALSWTPNTEPDLSHYALYRGSSPDFVPGPGNLVATTSDAAFLDAGWPGGDTWYKLTALDVHGNEGAAALLSPDQLTPVGDGPQRWVTRLEPNVPNPFNPATLVVFTLGARTDVQLRIHDAAGRLVRVLVRGPLDPGRHQVRWDGKDAAGRDVASGVYTCRMTAGDYRETVKLTLLR